MPVNRKPSGVMMVEVGETQAAEVSRLFEQAGLETETRKDLAGISRVVLGALRG